MGNYGMGYYAGVIFGVLIGVGLIVLLLKASKEDRSIRCRYDERQELVRGKGFKLGFFFLVIYNFLYMLFGDIAETAASRPIILATGMFFAIIVYVSYAIWHDGYVALNENPGRVVAVLASVSVLNFAVGVRNVLHYDLSQEELMDGKLNLLCGGMALAVLILLLAKRWIKKDKGQEEE